MENSQLLEYIGETKTQKLQNEISQIYFEEFNKKYPNFSYNHKMNSLVTVTKNFEIKSIGMSCINDLITDTWANFLGALLAGDFAVLPNPPTISGSTSHTLNVYSSFSDDKFNNLNFGSVGTLIQIGEGVTPATRQDINIENPFGSSPENTRLGTGVGGWNSGLGQIQIPVQMIAGSSGTISETCLYGKWRVTAGGGNETYLLSRDNISPVVNFIGGETINVDYSMVFN